MMKLKILLVDDDILHLDLMEEMLCSFGVDVIAVSDSEEAAMKAAQEKFDGIFVDLSMPKMNGFQLIEAIRVSPWNRTTPIIVVTGMVEKHTLTEAFRGGASFFMQKPIDRTRLRLLLNSTQGSMLENKRMLERGELKVEVKCQVGGTHAKVLSRNVSGRGILLESDASFKVGAMIKMKFSLPRQTEYIDAAGLIVRVDERGKAGVNFCGIRSTDRQRIKIYVSEVRHAAKANQFRPVLQAVVERSALCAEALVR